MSTEDADRSDVRRPHALWGALGGVALAGLSIYFMSGGLKLGLGTPFRPGTGAFPFFTGLILIVLSAGIIVQDLGSDGLAERPDWISFLAIGAALMVFALTAERFGLLPAVFLTTIIASAPDRSLHLPGKAILGVILAASSWVLFIEALGLPFKAFRGF
ncbi:tripartite tricarboxylate transporter TctB family protein [Amaricoccus macauensis]|uniref:tripartite tricarboxylate transporter TctB family protein n=1 Tax=Amaricoccus macauensis TaxID=57001 RepID=UPI003C7AFED8